MVTYLPVVALLLSFCKLGGYFQTIPRSCLQTTLGMERRRLSKHSKEQQAQPRCSQSHQDQKRSVLWTVSAKKPQTKFIAQRGPWLIVPHINREVDSNTCPPTLR